MHPERTFNPLDPSSIHQISQIKVPFPEVCINIRLSTHLGSLISIAEADIGS